MLQAFDISRRSFLKQGSLAAATSGLPLWFVQRELAAAEASRTVASPNNRPGIALIGGGGQGQGDMVAAANHGDVIVVCDVDQRHVDSAARRFAKDGRRPEKCSDFRKLLERDDVHEAGWVCFPENERHTNTGWANPGVILLYEPV